MDKKLKIRDSVIDALWLIPLEHEQITEKLIGRLCELAKYINIGSDSTYFDYAHKIKQSAALLGVSKSEFVKAAIKQPPLFYQKPETINSNIEKSAALLGVSKSEFVKAAIKQPSLFYQKPETINGNIEKSAALLGVSKSEFVKAAIKQPSLFYQKPETIFRNVRYIFAAQSRAAVQSESLINDALSYPVSFCCAPKNTCLRTIDFTTSNRQKRLSSFFRYAGKKQVEQNVINFYMDRIKRTGKGARTLQILEEVGIITQLPEGIEKPEKHLRQRDRSLEA